jgi:hypothetical protein
MKGNHLFEASLKQGKAPIRIRLSLALHFALSRIRTHLPLTKPITRTRPKEKLQPEKSFLNTNLLYFILTILYNE